MDRLRSTSTRVILPSGQASIVVADFGKAEYTTAMPAESNEVLTAELSALALLLRERLETIADHAWRDRDPEGQLAKLKSVSHAIGHVHSRLRGRIHARLDHFLTQCSYDKALEYLDALPR